ncbi:double zinc ribbon domain-containing protein [Desulfuromonas sp. DDH964]|uniref:double zinc ribbon domain-containing protein n=1 Tax=Desulfuromonas sp. DDH964 TaxID=1823759 RepID=UPI0012F9DEF4
MFCGSGWSNGWFFSGWIVPGLFLLALLGGAAWLLSRRTPASGLAPKACPRCGGSVQEVYFRCPHCGDTLKSNCPGCSRVVDQAWDYCPFCNAALKAEVKQPITTMTTDQQPHESERRVL